MNETSTASEISICSRPAAYGQGIARPAAQCCTHLAWGGQEARHPFQRQSGWIAAPLQQARGAVRLHAMALLRVRQPCLQCDDPLFWVRDVMLMVVLTCRCTGSSRTSTRGCSTHKMIPDTSWCSKQMCSDLHLGAHPSEGAAREAQAAAAARPGACAPSGPAGQPWPAKPATTCWLSKEQPTRRLQVSVDGFGVCATQADTGTPSASAHPSCLREKLTI